MSICRVIEKEMKKSNRRVRIVPVPEERRPDAASIAMLDGEIHARVRANTAMEQRSLCAASKGMLLP